MGRYFNALTISRALAVTCGVFAPSAFAAPVTYNIVQNQSQINLTAGGTIFGGALTVTEQHPTAITNYSGTIGTNVVSTGVSFPGAGSANAINTLGTFNIPRQYTPNINGGAGSAPANYGVTMNAPFVFDIPVINIPPEIIAGLPSPLNSLVPSSLDLGTLTSVVAKVALREVQLQVLSTGFISANAGVFDANETTIDVVGGFADINIAARLTQPNLVNKFLLQTLLGAVAGVVPQLGLTVSTPSIFSNDIDLGFGLRIDLSTLPVVANTAIADGTITGLLSPPGLSTIVLPVEFSLASGFADLLGPLAGILDFDLQFDFSGTLRATATIPEASSFVMMGLAGAGFLGVLVRRRKST